jgi:hypothetical protein
MDIRAPRLIIHVVEGKNLGVHNVSLCILARMYWHNPGIRNVIRDLQRMGPYWDRHGGADHIFVITADPGRCRGEAVIFITCFSHRNEGPHCFTYKLSNCMIGI